MENNKKTMVDKLIKMQKEYKTKTISKFLSTVKRNNFNFFSRRSNKHTILTELMKNLVL